MKKYLLLLVGLLPFIANADLPIPELEKAPIHRGDKESIKRGAVFYARNCMACHTMKYLRYDKVARRNGVLYEKMPIGMKWPASAVPPDLSLEADVRGVDWIYTYLHSFYTDPSRPTRFNNLLMHNTMMPDMLMQYQGQQVLAVDQAMSKTLDREWQWYDLVTLQKQGSMTPQQFDAAMADVVNFLDYAAEPFYEEAMTLAKRVLIYLSVLFVLTYLLKREYWKDVKKDE